MPPYLIKQSSSLCTYNSWQMSYLSSFVRISPGCEEREGSKNSKWKYLSPAGFEPLTFYSVQMLIQRTIPIAYANWDV